EIGIARGRVTRLMAAEEGQSGHLARGGRQLPPAPYRSHPYPTTRPADFGISSRISVLVSRNGSRPSVPPSRPMPDCLKPPKAMLKSVRNELCPTVPDRSCRAVA